MKAKVIVYPWEELAGSMVVSSMHFVVKQTGLKPTALPLTMSVSLKECISSKACSLIWLIWGVMVGARIITSQNVCEHKLVKYMESLHLLLKRQA